MRPAADMQRQLPGHIVPMRLLIVADLSRADGQAVPAEIDAEGLDLMMVDRLHRADHHIVIRAVLIFQHVLRHAQKALLQPSGRAVRAHIDQLAQAAPRVVLNRAQAAVDHAFHQHPAVGRCVILYHDSIPFPKSAKSISLLLSYRDARPSEMVKCEELSKKVTICGFVRRAGRSKKAPRQRRGAFVSQSTECCPGTTRQLP